MGVISKNVCKYSEYKKNTTDESSCVLALNRREQRHRAIPTPPGPPLRRRAPLPRNARSTRRTASSATRKVNVSLWTRNLQTKKPPALTYWLPARPGPICIHDLRIFFIVILMADRSLSGRGRKERREKKMAGRSRSLGSPRPRPRVCGRLSGSAFVWIVALSWVGWFFFNSGGFSRLPFVFVEIKRHIPVNNLFKFMVIQARF